jgi:hypothetical protein
MFHRYKPRKPRKILLFSPPPPPPSPIPYHREEKDRGEMEVFLCTLSWSVQHTGLSCLLYIEYATGSVSKQDFQA